MLRYLLKKIGRLFLILDQPDNLFIFSGVRNVLIVSLSEEEHLNKAIPEIRKKFMDAKFSIVFPSFKSKIISRYDDYFEKSVGVDSCSVARYLEELRNIKPGEPDIVVLLSLNPFLVKYIFGRFDSPKLLYNYCDEMYVIRRKSIGEFLKGKEGADRKYKKRGIKIFRLMNVVAYLILGGLRLLFKRKTV